MINDKVIHDIRAPLLKAKTIIKLLIEEDSINKDYKTLLKLLAELEEKINQLTE